MRFEYQVYVARLAELAGIKLPEDWKRYESVSITRLCVKSTLEAARQTVLEYLKTNGVNKAELARAFGIYRSVVYDILKSQNQTPCKIARQGAPSAPANLSGKQYSI